MEDRVKIEIKDGVADVRMVRTDKMNALDQKMREDLASAIAQLDADPDVRVVVLSGDGRAFCAGLDMGSMGQMSKGEYGKSDEPGVGRLEKRTHGIVNLSQHVVWGWRQLKVPVIAAVHGVALGGGFQIMLGADIRITHPDTKLSILEIKWGLVPDMGATPIMRHYVRDDIIRELTYTGRMFSGQEAQGLGFTTHVSETPLEDALALAREIASKSPDAIRAAKRMYNALPEVSEAEALMTESLEQDRLIGSPNQIEAVNAGLEKRDADFKTS